MGWVKMDNGIGNHRKSLALSEDGYLPAVGLLLLMVAYCDQQRTDGLVPGKALPRIAFGDWQTALDELVRVGYVSQVDAGYEVVNYLDWQQSAEQIEAYSQSQRVKALHRWNPDGIADGIADKTRQDETDIPDVTRQTAEPITRAQTEELRGISGNRLGLDAVCALGIAYGYEITLEAVRRARRKAESGEEIRDFHRLTVGIADNLVADLR